MNLFDCERCGDDAANAGWVVYAGRLLCPSCYRAADAVFPKRLAADEWTATGLPVRVWNSMVQSGWRPRDVPTATDDDLLGTRHIGRGALRQLRALFPVLLPDAPAWSVIC